MCTPLALTCASLRLRSEFDARPVDSDVATQPPLPEPRRVTTHYAAGDNEDGDGKVRLPAAGCQSASAQWHRQLQQLCMRSLPTPRRPVLRTHASCAPAPANLAAGVRRRQLGAHV